MDTSNLFTVEECIAQINAQLQQYDCNQEINARLLRHYISEGVVPKAIRDGKFAKYHAGHVAAVVALRVQQQRGLSSKAFKTYTQSAPSLAVESSHVQHNASTLGISSPVFSASAGGQLQSLRAHAVAAEAPPFAVHGTGSASLQSLHVSSEDMAKTVVSLQQLVESSVRAQAQEYMSDAARAVSDETLNQRARALEALRGGTSPKLGSSVSGALGSPMVSLPMAPSISKSVQSKWIDVDCGAGIRLQIREDRASTWTAKDTEQLANTLNLWKDSL